MEKTENKMNGNMEEIEGSKEKSVLSLVGRGILYAGAGLLLGSAEVGFSAAPLGMALLCASGVGNILFVLLGLCVSALETSAPAVYITSYGIAFLLRLLVCLSFYTPNKTDGDGEKRLGDALPFLFDEAVVWRALAAAIGGFLVGFYRLVTGGFLYYDVYFTLVFSLGGAVGCILLSGSWRKRYGKEGGLAWQIGYIALVSALVFSTTDLNVYGISVSCLICFMGTLIAAFRYGVFCAVPVGLLGGLIFSISYAPLFVFSALAVSALRKTPAGLISFVAFCVAMGIAFYVRGIAALGEVMGALFAASVLFYMLVKISAIRIEEKKDGAGESEGVIDTAYEEDAKDVAKAESYLDRESLDKKRLESVNERMKRIGYAFSSLSSVMSEMNKRMGGEKKASVGTGMDTLDRTEIFAADYDAISDLLADAMVVAESDHDVSHELEMRIIEEIEGEFSEVEVSTIGVSVWGQRKKTVSFRCEEKGFLAENKEIFDRIVGAVFPEMTFESDYTDEGVAEYRSAPKLEVSFAHRIVSAVAEEEYCGDSAGALYDDDDRFFAFISDGMGSGKEAAVTSGYVSLFLCKLLGASSPASSVIKMINSFLRGRNSSSEDECSATVDLMELDTLSGGATFYKSGASPTYVFRNGNLFKLRAKSAPLGILRGTSVRKVSFDVSVGDLIVMVSDGVTGGKEECPRLFDTVRGLSRTSSAEDVADAVVKYAKSEASSDDISVIAVRILGKT